MEGFKSQESDTDPGTFVNWYVHEQMHIKDGKVLSAKVLGEKFNLKESTLGKLLNA